MTDTNTRRRRGLGTIESAPKGRKRARLTTSAGRIPIGTFASAEAADTALEAARAELAAGAHVRGLTLQAWGARFLDGLELAGYVSVGKARSCWRSHIESSSLADRLLELITDLHVLEWAEVLVRKKARGSRGKGQKVSRSTAQNALNLLRGAFEAAVTRHMIKVNPARAVKLPAGASPTHEPWTYLTATELAALLACDAIPRRHLLWIAFAVGSGVREGEMFNLHLRDVHASVDEPKPRIVVRYGSAKRGPKRTRGTHAKIRTVPLFGLALQAVREWLTVLPSYCPKNPLGLVFPGPTGARKAPGKHLHFTVRGADKKPRPVNPLPGYLAAAGITRSADEASVCWHSWRHTCAAGLLSGYWGGYLWTLEQVQALLGHESKVTTERYAHLAEGALHTAAAKTQEALDAPRIGARRPRPAAHKPDISPEASPGLPPKQAANAEKRTGSRFRDLNSRPTVYETVALPLS